MSFKLIDEKKVEQAIINAMNHIKKDCTPKFFSNIVPYNFECTITSMDSVELKYLSNYDIDKLFKETSKFINEIVDLDGIIEPIIATVSVEYYNESTGEITDTEICEICIDSDETDMYFSFSVSVDDNKNEVFINYLLSGINTGIVDKVSVEIGVNYQTGEVYDTCIETVKKPIESTLASSDPIVKTSSVGSMASSVITKFEKKDDNLVSFTFETDVLDEILKDMIETEYSEENTSLNHFVNKIENESLSLIACSNIEEVVVVIIQLYKRFIADKKVKASESFSQPFDFDSSVCGEYVQSAKKILEDKAGNGKVYVCIVESEIRKQIMLQEHNNDVDEIYKVVEYKDIKFE